MKTLVATILITLAMLAVMALGNVLVSSAGASFGRLPRNGEFRPHHEHDEGHEDGSGGGEMLGSLLLTTVVTAGAVQLIKVSRRRRTA
ncbi:MAG: hypothetical protein ACK5C8_08480 [Roseiflexaceae bacterium]|jgi:hypothetical protein|nr:hypothetical protein [Chloroflexaceae bacterium]MCE2852228.1 hypothetical protein [Chloroflexaceae bacterium]